MDGRRVELAANAQNLEDDRRAADRSELFIIILVVDSNERFNVVVYDRIDR